MKIAVIGANGRTGKLIIEMALSKGWAVVAYLRDKTKLPIAHSNLAFVEGDAFNEAKIAEAVEGCDAVVSALGQTDISGDVSLMSEGMKRIIPAMKSKSIQRIVAVGGMGALQASKDVLIKDLPDFPKMYVNVSEDHFRVFDLLKNSQLTWTQVCCPYIPDGAATENYSVRKDYMPQGKQQIFTGDVAHFIVQEIELNSYTNTRVGISN